MTQQTQKNAPSNQDQKYQPDVRASKPMSDKADKSANKNNMESSWEKKSPSNH
jgi:hypothetical protein